MSFHACRRRSGRPRTGTAIRGLALAVLLSGPILDARASGGPPAYPETPRRPVADSYHGQDVVDPYRWLEDGSDPEVRRWSDAQNAVTRAWLDALPDRAAILARLEEITAGGSADYFSISYRNGIYFALKNQPPKQQPMLVRFDSPRDLGNETVLVDPNALDPTSGTAIDFYEPSPDGRLVAVSMSQGGSESGAASLFDAATGERHPDLLPGVNGGTAGGSIAWTGRGFLRTRYPQPGERPEEDLGFYEELWYHQLGRPAAEDRYVFGHGLPRIAEIFAEATDDGRYVLVDVLNGDGGEHAFYLLDTAAGDFIARGESAFRPVSRFEDGIVDAEMAGDSLYLLERRATPMGRILRVPLASPDLASAETVLPASEAAIEGLAASGSTLYATLTDGGPNRVVLLRPGGERCEIPLPRLVSVGGIVRTEADRVLVRVESHTAPAAWYAYDPAAPRPCSRDTGRLDPTALVKKSLADFSGIDDRREFATSRDGTKVPLTILFKTGTPLDGTAPALLSGYGGFGITISPSFDERNIVWLEHGGVLAIANLRGGGEYGEAWHQAGMLTKKQNVFDDFAACARILAELRYADPARIAIEGGSNGGLLMGAALTQNPQLYRAVVARVGLFDMLRNELTPNGSFNVTEYGTVKDPEQFRALAAYSPYRRVVDGTPYPAVLLMTGENDPRVDPYHSRKMAARLQAATSSGLPVLLRTSSGTGHGIGTPLSERNAEEADVYAFLFDQLGISRMQGSLAK